MEKRKYLYYNLNKVDKNKNNLIYNDYSTTVKISLLKEDNQP